jgi:hypothetical protein
MAKFADISERLVNVAQSHPLVNTVIFDTVGQEKDLYKKNIMPLFHILPQQATVENNSITIQYEIAVLNDRDVSKSLERQKIGDNSNYMQNMDTCLQILEDVLTEFQLAPTDDFILEVVDPIQPLFLHGVNQLDGWFGSINIRVPKFASIC